MVVEGRVVAGSQYADAGGRSVRPGLPAEVRAFADGMLAAVRWRPDPAFMLDVCETEPGGDLWLVELNGFGSSWLYAADVREVVAAAGELAARQWEAAGRRAG